MKLGVIPITRETISDLKKALYHVVGSGAFIVICINHNQQYVTLL
jgi:hypothetical protein